MKPVIIISIAVGCSVAIFFALSIYDVDDIVKTQVLSYDCAKNFDKTVQLRENLSRSTDYDSGQKILVELQRIPIEMMENRCFITIESWAHESTNESEIWYEMDWQTTSYLNQIILGEVQCEEGIRALGISCEKIIENFEESKKTLKVMMEN